MLPSWIELISRHTHINTWLSWQSLPDHNLQRSNQAKRSLLKLSNNICICRYLSIVSKRQYTTSLNDTRLAPIGISQSPNLIPPPFPWSTVSSHFSLSAHSVQSLMMSIPVNDSSATSCSQREHLMSANMTSALSLCRSADKTVCV